MNRVLLGLFIGCIMSLAFAGVSFAGANADAGISLHIASLPVRATDCIADAPKILGPHGANRITSKSKSCQNSGIGTFDVWVVVCAANDSVGIAGMEFGIEYDAAFGSGVDVTSWTLCGEFDFVADNFPASGGGNLVTWEPSLNCQRQPPRNSGGGTGDDGEDPTDNEAGVQAVAGVFRVTVYGADQMEIVARPVSGALKVADCVAVEDDITGAATPRGGIAAFCTNRNGYNYCRGFELPTTSTTWGAIKGKYNN